MSDFKAYKMHQIRFASPKPHWGSLVSLQRSPRYPSYVYLFNGLILLREGREKEEENGMEGKIKGTGDEVDGGIWPTQKFGVAPLWI